MISIILDEDKIYKKLMNFEDYIESSKESKFGFGTKGLL